MSRGETQPRGGAGELEDEEGRGVMGTARYEADNEVLLGWNDDLPLCLQEDCCFYSHINILSPVQWNEGSCFDNWSQFEPGQGHQREGEDAEGGGHDQGEQRAEHQAHLDHEYVVDITLETV